MCVLLIAAFAMGGGARGDIQSLMILRPLSALLLGYALIGLGRSHIRENRFLLGLTSAVLLLLVIHLVPMPMAMWSALPGREVIAQIDKAAELGQLWRPLSMAPDATRNALYASILPLAALLLGIRLDPRERLRLLGLILALGGVSAALGLAQSIGGQNSPLRFYKITNDFGAVGLFANRNHQALLLTMLLPMLAVWAASRDRAKGAMGARMPAALLAGAALIPLILITGSRAGLVLAIVALLLVPAVLWGWSTRSSTGSTEQARVRDGRGRRGKTLAIVGSCLGLAVLTIAVGRGVALQRILDSHSAEELRFAILPALLTMIRAYFPFGSGIGSFERVYQLDEPDAMLDPSYTNHAHNDWLELAMTGGLPALILLAVAIVACLVKARTLFAQGIVQSAELRLARLGLALILLSALASIGDYPLRVPSLACLFVVALLWISCPLPKNRPIDVTS